MKTLAIVANVDGSLLAFVGTTAFEGFAAPPFDVGWPHFPQNESLSSNSSPQYNFNLIY